MVKVIKELLSDTLRIGREAYSMKTAEINAVYSEELEEFLDSLGVLEEIKNGEKKCYFCNSIVDVSDIQTVFPMDDDVQICCNKSKCNDAFNRKVEK
ncbi:hypothetical protein [Gracilibacillus sp. YIM 98692]|uniref:hypothetical protein n=1 Tax=Gracilibacillus sp. YIM 98692 TaxID=2663532 RepID=UPI0013D496B0|nr:hypothetical protein [Gracilibacillus sp. YIM 98692]